MYRHRNIVWRALGRQQAVDRAMVVDEACDWLVCERSPMDVASWNDDRVPPLLWQDGVWVQIHDC